MYDNNSNARGSIICILGYDRSGTTLIGKLFSKFNDVEYFGELDYAYYYLKQNHDRVCSCGEDLDNCMLWRDINVVPNTTLSDFYMQLFNVSKTSFLIDSSKNIDHLKKVEKEVSRPINFIHIIRCPKGVAYSRMKTRKRRVEKGNHPKIYLAKRTNLMMIYDCLEWSVRNIRIELLKRNKQSFKTIYYENLEKDFDDLVNSVLGDNRNIQTLFLEDESINHHVLYGNINRFKQVNLPIKTDESWKKGLKKYQKVLIDIITFPTRILFNYQFK